MTANDFLVVLIVLLSVILITLVVGIALVIRRIQKTAREVEATLKVVREGIVPLVSQFGQAVSNFDSLVYSTRAEIGKVGQFVKYIEKLLELRNIAGTAGKAVLTSKINVVSVLEGIRQGVKVLKGSRNDAKEGSKNE